MLRPQLPGSWIAELSVWRGTRAEMQFPGHGLGDFLTLSPHGETILLSSNHVTLSCKTINVHVGSVLIQPSSQGWILCFGR